MWLNEAIYIYSSTCDLIACTVLYCIDFVHIITPNMLRWCRSWGHGGNACRACFEAPRSTQGQKGSHIQSIFCLFTSFRTHCFRSNPIIYGGFCGGPWWIQTPASPGFDWHQAGPERSLAFGHWFCESLAIGSLPSCCAAFPLRGKTDCATEEVEWHQTHSIWLSVAPPSSKMCLAPCHIQTRRYVFTITTWCGHTEWLRGGCSCCSEICPDDVEWKGVC